MAYSSRSKNPLPLAAKLNVPLTVGKHEYVPKPPMEEERTRIRKSQVFIPYSISEKTHAFLGPLRDPNVKNEKLKEIFLSYHHTSPITCLRQPIDLNYMIATFRVFHSAPSTKNKEDYIAWIDKVEYKKANI